MYLMEEATGNVDLAMVEPFVQAVIETTDESLANAARNGDDSAFEQLFERHRRRITRLVGRFFNRPERVEEILQEIFTKVYFGLTAYSSERGSSFSAWLSRVAINSCYDELRRARRRPESALSEITTDEITWLNAQVKPRAATDDAESAVIARDLANKLLARLSAEDRLVLILLDAEELSVAEIATAMKWTASKVKVRAHRARHSLRKVLEEFE